MNEQEADITWRLTDISVGDESSYVAVLTDRQGNTREYIFTAETVDMAGVPLLMFKSGSWDNDTIFDRPAFKAVHNAIHAFHEAHQRSIGLGDSG